MRCAHCDFENSSGTYRCQKCGNSLLPPLPREIYTSLPAGNVIKVQKRVRLLAIVSLVLTTVVVFGGIALLFVSSAQVFAGSVHADAPVVEEVAQAEVREDLQPLTKLEPQDNTVQLPDSDVVIGLPPYKSYEVNIDFETGKVDHTFHMQNGQKMNILCYKMDYPFTRSAQEDYFMQENRYALLYGSEDQYIMMENPQDQARATVIDRIHKNNYEIILSYDHADPFQSVDQMQEILQNEIFSRCSLVPKCTD